ncbi:MAG: [LysW]-lysine hydrolase [Anaerolineales bacterium]|nr:[LysW]-lysine hydrolase [Anaerolineales bacterium]
MDPVGFLQELLSIPSPTGQEDALAKHLVERMRMLGFEAQRDAAGNVLGSLGRPDAARTVMLLGHMDTVTGDVPVRIEQGRLYGRGAVDAKGPLATFVLAAAAAAHALADSCRIVVAGVVEEEGCGKGAHYLAETFPAPTCTIIGEPSGWEAITLGYKGMLNLDYRLVQPGGHSAGEFPGPAEKAVAFWNRVMTYAEQRNQGRFGHFDTLDPALREFRTFSTGLDDGVEINIVLRLPMGTDIEALKQQMIEWRNGCGATLDFIGSDPAFRSEKNTPPVRTLLRAIRAHGGQPTFKLKTGTSDMNVVGPVWRCPIVAYGPGDSSMDHTPDEHTEIAEYLRGLAVLTQALESLGAS